MDDNWFARHLQRQRDLAQGADVDLVRDNSDRYKLAFGLMGLGFLLGLVDAKIRIPRTLHFIGVGMAALSFIAGLLLAKWAHAEYRFLSKPDPKLPPSMFKQ